jgi:hypothetical protein
MYAHMWLYLCTHTCGSYLSISLSLYIPTTPGTALSVFYCSPLGFLFKNEFSALGRFAFVLFFSYLGAERQCRYSERWATQPIPPITATCTWRLRWPTGGRRSTGGKLIGGAGWPRTGRNDRAVHGRIEATNLVMAEKEIKHHASGESARKERAPSTKRLATK